MAILCVSAYIMKGYCNRVLELRISPSKMLLIKACVLSFHIECYDSPFVNLDISSSLVWLSRGSSWTRKYAGLYNV